MTSQNTDMERALSNAESLGTIGSPSTTTEIKMNILGAAAENKIVGEYAIFRYRQQNADQFALGQITEVRLRNRMLEDHTILTLARSRGQVDHVSDQQDTHEGDLRVSAAYQQTQAGYQESSMGTVPRTGTDIKKATNELVNEIIQEHADNVFYLGTAYQSELDLPMWFRQFNGAPGQLAEAHHIGIFGRTGSGKSTLAKLILLAYATHPEMGILIIDPQGEFAKSINGEPENFAISMRARLSELNRSVVSIDVDNIVLNRWDLVVEMLEESSFITEAGISTHGPLNPKESAATKIVESLRSDGVTLTDLHEHRAFEIAIQSIQTAVQEQRLYSGAGPNDRIIGRIAPSNHTTLYQNHWRPLMELFNSNRSQAIRTDRVIERLMNVGSGNRPRRASWPRGWRGRWYLRCAAARFQLRYSGGRERRSAPERAIRSTPATKRRR